MTPARRARVRLGAAVLAGLALAVVLARLLTRCPRPEEPLRPGIRARVLRTLTGHSSVVGQVAFSPDGRTLASASADRTVGLWRVEDGARALTLTHPQGATSVAFAPDGRWLATGSYDGIVRIWSLPDGKLERALAGHAGTVWTVAVAPDGQRVASGGEDRTVRLWRASDGAALETLVGHERNVWSVAFSPDGRRLASGSFDRTARVWDAGTGALLRTLSGHTEAVVELAFSPDSALLATGGDDSSVRLWRVEDGSLRATLTGCSEHVYAVAFSPDGRWLASGGRERGALGTLWENFFGQPPFSAPGRTMRLWRVRDGALQQSLAGHGDDVHSVAFSPDGRALASSGDDRTVRLWSLETAAADAAPTP